ncbi:hypothetical protein [Coleofasciculus sp. H7-2]|uniref:hypothetical protein n=1 Tax=Coleofasciculus sp. H7-2 TaxID=3351545 RepID=UPI00366FD5B0
MLVAGVLCATGQKHCFVNSDRSIGVVSILNPLLRKRGSIFRAIASGNTIYGLS